MNQRDSGKLGRVLGLGLVCLVSGCAGRTILLHSATGEQWVWPYFLDEKPTVIAFWNTNEMQCQRDVPPLKGLDLRDGSVQLVTVVTGRDRREIDQWIREKRIHYTVLLDLDETLADRLSVREYPSYLYFASEGKEIGRTGDIRLVHNWFDRDRWLERSGAIQPTSSRDIEFEPN